MAISEVSLQADRAPRRTPPEKGLRWRLINTGVGIAAFIATCMALHVLLPFPEIEAISQKLRLFVSHKDEFDTLFIGSSHIYCQISPAVFDDVTRELGRSTRSFNFGINGMNLPESAYVLEQVLKTKPRNLKWIFLEFDELQTNWPNQVEGSRRALYWHDWRRTSLVLRDLLGAGTGPRWLPKIKKLRDIVLCRKREANTHKLVSFHVREFQRNFTNVGRAGDIIDHLARTDEGKFDVNYVGAARDGYVPLIKQMSPGQTATYEQALALAMTQAKPQLVLPYTEEACRQSAERIRRLGAAPIFLVTPTTRQSRLSFRGDRELPGSVLLFNDAQSYPNLYRSDVRMDQGHMIKQAAEEFTALLATRFVQLVQRGEIH